LSMRYIMGRCGQGKTRQVLAEIKAQLDAGGEEPLILLVPEQFTLQAERDVINRLGLPGIMRLEVLSPSRVGSRVLHEAGGRTRVLLSEKGRYMVLRKIIAACEEQLTVFRRVCQQPGFIEQCSRMLSELKNADINSEMLDECGLQLPDDILLKDKLHDIALIYNHFNTYLRDRYLDSEDQLNLVIERLPESPYFSRAKVWIDNFNTLSPATLKLIEQIMKTAASTTISLTMELGGEDRDRELFALSRYYYNRLHSKAREEGLNEQIIMVKDWPHNGRSPDLQHLEKELYAYPHRPYTGPVENISIVATASLQDEVELIAMKILSLVQQQQYRYRDIAVICSDTASYAGPIKRVFDEYQIPFFLDEKRSIMHHPLIELVLAALDMVIKHYRLEDVLRYMKTGLTPLQVEECDRLENYALRYSVQGQRWLEPFTLGDEALRDESNAYRQALIAPVKEMAVQVQGEHNWAQIARACFEWLEKIQIPQRLESWVEELMQEERFELASENRQIWNVIVEVLDQIAAILGEEKTTLKEFRQVLEMGLASSELGLIPSTVDQVLVGTITRSISQHGPVLLLAGVNDGLLPRGREPEGMLSIDEKELLQAQGVKIGIDNDLQAIEEDFLIYATLSRVKGLLQFSYPLSDFEGKALRPSLLIERLKQIYTGIKVSTRLIDAAAAEDHYLLSAPSSYKYMIENLRQALDGKAVSPRWEAVYDWFKAKPEWQSRLAGLEEALLFANRPGAVPAAQWKQLYAGSRQTSVSRLELYAACPFAHFVRYGLRPLERKSYEVEAPEVGELFHQAILNFAVKMHQQQLSWEEMRQEQCHTLMEQVMDQLLPAHGEGVFMSTHRYRYLGQRLKRIGQRAVWTLARHLKSGEFQPLGYEMRFGPGGAFPAVVVELADGETVSLEGRIDRVDVYDDGEDSYVRIIDYKSGPRDLDMSDIYYGLNLQLLIYLQAVLAGFNTPYGAARPGGIFYFHIDDPMIEADEDIVEEIEKKLAARLRLRGLALEEANVIRAMDRDINGYSLVVPVGMSGEGKFYSQSALFNLDQFEMVLNYVQNLVRQISQEMMSGHIEIAPFKKGQQRACTYCRYHAVCQFDTLFAANRYRHLPVLDRDQLISRITTGTGRGKLS
jgi:ATP-dependent helicase/nuclease subunit B